MKRKIFLLGVLGICLAILAAGTIAYFTGEDTAHNVVTSGGVAIAILDKTDDGNGGLADFPPDGLMGVMPATGASRIVSVANTGEREAWVRMKATPEIFSQDGMPLPLLLDEGVPAVTFAVDGEKWTMKDGWYYYTAPVAAGTATEALFEQVDFSSRMDNTYQNAKASMKIYAQAVQTANNGDGVMDAAGWPSEVIE